MNLSDLDKIREYVDGAESFTTGHQIKSYMGRAKEIPAWTKSNVKIQAILLKVFPKLLTDDKQRQRAAIWARVIYLYYRLGYTYSQVAEEMELVTPGAKHPYAKVERVIQHLRNVAKGMNTHGGPKGRRGRPRNNRGAKGRGLMGTTK